MNTAELTIVKAKLLSLKTELVKNISFLSKEKSRFGAGLTRDMDDQSIIIENDEVIDELDNLKLMELRNIDRALFRISSGDYETCEVCSEKIAIKRLNAVPYTNKCIHCSEMQ